MQEANARTLGEYFAGLDPEERRIRGPKSWTAREMYLTNLRKCGWTNRHIIRI